MIQCSFSSDPVLPRAHRAHHTGGFTRLPSNTTKTCPRTRLPPSPPGAPAVPTRGSTLTFRLPAEGALGLCKQKERERLLLRGPGCRLHPSSWRDGMPTTTVHPAHGHSSPLGTGPANPASEQMSLQRTYLSKYFIHFSKLTFSVTGTCTHCTFSWLCTAQHNQLS